MTKVDLCVII